MIPKRLKKRMRMYLTYSSIALILFLLFMLFNVNPFKLLIMALIIGLATVSKLYKHFIGISLGFELITPMVIIFAYQVGVIFAILTAIFTVVASDMLSGNLKGHAMTVEIIIYIVISIIVAISSSIGVSFISIAFAMVILRNVTMWLIMVIPGFVDPFRGTMATLPNVFINGFIVRYIGVFVIGLL